jgi:hypothetical protein
MSEPTNPAGADVHATRVPTEDPLAEAWRVAKAAKPDLTDAEKTAFEAARDSTKQLLALSTGVIALTITFAKDFVGSVTPARSLALIAWFLYLASAFFGLWALNALTGSAGTLRPSQWLSIQSRNIVVPAAVQVLTFVSALTLTVIYGAIAAAAAPNIRQLATRDSVAQATSNMLTIAEIEGTFRARVAERSGVVSPDAADVLHALATVAATRIDRRPGQALPDSIVDRTKRMADAAVSSSAAPASTPPMAAAKGKERPRPSPKAIGPGDIIKGLNGLCPIFPFCF